jgi:hypothetical protein
VQERERAANSNSTFTRRRFLQAAGGGAALITLGGTLGCDPAPRARAKAASAPAGQAWNFRSRPDLHPPVGEVLFEWHSLEHAGLDESYTKLYDYFHINSIDVFDGDHLLISFRFPWSRQSIDDPAIAAELGADDEVKIYASWNGATDVATWQVLAGAGPNQLEPLASAPSQGFETVITVHTTEPYLGLKAMNGSGRVLGTTSASNLENHA